MMRRLLTLLILAAMLATGCASRKAAVPPVTAGNEEPGPAQEQTGQTPPSQPAGDTVPVAEAPANTFQHYAIKPGEPIGRNGIFFMKSDTGAVDGWSLGDDPNRRPWYSASADNRWVTAIEQKSTYLLDRKTGTAYQWPVTDVALLAAHGDSLLFRTGTAFWVSRDALKHLSPVALKPEGSQAVLAPDGQTAVLVTGSKVYLLDVSRAAVREIGQLPAGDVNTWLATLRQGQEVVVGLYPAPGTRNTEHRVQRYGWTGTQLADVATPAQPQFSPDGALAAWPDQVLGMVDALVVGSGSGFAPRFRLVGNDTCPDGGPGGNPWLADSSALVVRTGQGYRLLRADGSLVPMGLGELGYWDKPVPAPDRADRYALGGLKVVDQTGRVLAAAVPNAEGNMPGSTGIAPWGESSDEVRFVLGVGGKDYGCLGAILPPQVEPAPFATITGLEVAVAANDCVNLRQWSDRTSPVITCMKNGTRLTRATPPGQINKGYLGGRADSLAVNNMGGEGWWFVRLETGQRGWVMLSGEYLRLAVARPGAPAPDPVANLVADETENLLFWIGVAGGETPCGQACAGGTSWTEVVWALADACHRPEPRYGYIRKEPGFDPARHEAGVTALETGCKALGSAWDTLGEPTDSAAWRQAVAGVKAGLTNGR